MPIQGHVIAIVTPLTLAESLALYSVTAFYALQHGVFQYFELFRGFS